MSKKPVASKTAVVLSASRRYADLKVNGEIISVLVESKAIDIVAGDEVEFSGESGDLVVKKVLPRKNCLLRRYRKIEKKLAANLDLVLIVAAVRPLFNVSFVDRMIAASNEQEIPHVLIVNKTDLGMESTNELVDIYRRVGIKVLEVSAAVDEELNELKEVLEKPGVKKAALAGISGVGKSTILNRLIPAAGRRTEAVSARTGQGRQTTSQSYGYPYPLKDGGEILLIDLPGLSSFGVTHLIKENVRFYFKEFAKHLPQCQYTDCLHIKEPQCAVKAAVDKKEIAFSRYRSYIEIIEEIENAREY